jgi:hypothetical protein
MFQASRHTEYREGLLHIRAAAGGTSHLVQVALAKNQLLETAVATLADELVNRHGMS